MANDTTKKNSNPTGKKKKATVRNVVNGIIIVFLCCVLLGGVTGFFLLSQIIGKVSEDERKLEEKIINVEPSTLYSADGKVIYELGAESREIVEYEQIPQVTIDAFLAIEDSRYFKHNGFDLPRFISSAFNNLRSGSLAQGGSTLTMQTIDNFINKPKEEKADSEGIKLTQKDKIEMKIQEIYLSLRLDSKMSKEEILTNYLNKINFGASARGIQKGAQYYFGKNVEQLNLSESAFLAGVVNAPALYNPYQGYDSKTKQNYYAYATKRRNETLSLMLSHGYISESEYKLAKATKLAFQLKGESKAKDNPYLAYAQAAITEARELTGEDPATTPMKIYTALDTSTQDRLNDIQEKKVIGMPENKYFQIAASVIDNRKGTIIAIGTGFDDPTSSTYKDRATKEKHQPGSTPKPLLAYAQAFDQIGWATSRIVEDKPIQIYGDTKSNYDNKYHGKVSLERALAQSLNIPALEAMQAVTNAVGNDYMREYMKKLGFDDKVAEKFDLLYAIGGANFEATPTQMAAAFATLANGGKYIEPHMITKVVYKDGSKTYENNAKTTQAMSPQAAYMTSDLLNKAITGKYSGYNYMSQAFNGAGYPVYGKTGTSDWDDYADEVGGNAHDGWMVNYTSDYTIASWNGFDSRVNGYTYLSEAVQNMNIPGKINRYILDSLSSNATRIQNPGGISSYGGGLIKTEFLKDAAKNNPETVANVKKASDALKSPISDASKYKQSDYTPETWAALQEALKQANALLNKEDVTEDEVNRAKQALENAIRGLKEKEVAVTTTSLTSAIQNAAAYTDTTKYQSAYVQALNSRINAANALLTSSGVTQAEINQAVQDIQAAIEACKAHPVQEVTPPNNNNQKPNDNTNNNANTDKNDNTNKGDTASGTGNKENGRPTSNTFGD